LAVRLLETLENLKFLLGMGEVFWWYCFFFKQYWDLNSVLGFEMGFHAC
jgi:hypothetical protein